MFTILLRYHIDSPKVHPHSTLHERKALLYSHDLFLFGCRFALYLAVVLLGNFLDFSLAILSLVLG